MEALVKPEATTHEVVTRSAGLRWLCRSLCWCCPDNGTGGQQPKGSQQPKGGRQQPDMEVVTIDSIEWKQIGTLAARRTTTKKVDIGVTRVNSKKQVKSKTYNASFEVSPTFTWPIGATVAAKAAASTALSSIAESMSSTTMTYKETYTEVREASAKSQNIWGLTMTGVLLADSRCVVFRTSVALPLHTRPTPANSQARRISSTSTPVGFGLIMAAVAMSRLRWI